MKYLRLFENHKSIDEIEDLLLAYIDDDFCATPKHQPSNGEKDFIRVYAFHDESKLKEAITLLKSKGVDNYFVYMNFLYIYSFSIEKMFKSQFLDCKVIDDSYGKEWKKLGGIYAEYDKHIGFIYVDQKRIWNTYVDTFSMKELSIRCFLSHMFFKYFNIQSADILIFNVLK